MGEAPDRQALIVDRTVDASPRPLLVAVGSQGWADQQRAKQRRRERRALIVLVAVSFALIAVAVLS
jgi:hypothetical protein